MKAKKLILISSIFCLFGFSSNPHKYVPAQDNKLYLNAQVGDSDSQYKLANKYNFQPGLLRKKILAKKWYRAAALNNHVESQNKLGLLYLELKNYLEAKIWFESAVKSDHVGAHANLAEMYEKGKGMFINISKAHTLYHKAAISGHVKSMYKVSVNLISSKVIKRDLYTGCVWAFRASNSIKHISDSVLEKNINALKQDCNLKLSESVKINALEEASKISHGDKLEFRSLMSFTN